MDAISLVQFIIPGMLGLVFTLGALAYMRQSKDDPAYVAAIFCSVVATVCWWGFSATWIGVTTDQMYTSFALLFMGLGFCTFGLLLYNIVMALKNSANAEGPQLTIRENKEIEP